VDESFGLPTEWNEFIKSETPRFPIDGMSYESTFDDVFVGGWSRKASSGLVGYARKDGTNAAKALWQYLQTKQTIEPDLETLTQRLNSLNKPLVLKEHVKKLDEAELAQAKQQGLEAFKFDTNEEMLKVMGLMQTA
jgi:ferredoxin--NADP+ reductase